MNCWRALSFKFGRIGQYRPAWIVESAQGSIRLLRLTLECRIGTQLSDVTLELHVKSIERNKPGENWYEVIKCSTKSLWYNEPPTNVTLTFGPGDSIAHTLRRIELGRVIPSIGCDSIRWNSNTSQYVGYVTTDGTEYETIVQFVVVDLRQGHHEYGRTTARPGHLNGSVTWT